MHLTTRLAVPPAAGAPLAVVTGASRGIGAATARRLARDGYAVAVHYGESSAAAAETVRAIRDAGGVAFAFGVDLAAPDLGTRFWDGFESAAGSLQRAPVHVLVNNAGVTLRGPIDGYASEDFERQHRINAAAPFFVTQAALPRMADGGRIVNLSSGVTRIAFPDALAYAMTKGAIEAFTLTLAQQLGPRRITVNAVAPGVIDTDMNAWLHERPEAARQIVADIALGRIGRPDDVADVIAFLASDEARWITGQTIDATGGSRL